MIKNISQLYMPKLITGRGSLDFFATLGKKRIGIVRGGKSFNGEIQEEIETLAKKNGAQICYLTQIRNEPYIDDIFSCMEKVREFEPDMILAIGGGSVLDTAKAIHLFYENPELDFKDALVPFSLPQIGKKAIHISVPTTSGTGSETTSVAVFIDPDTKTKKLIMDSKIIPHYAVLDANLTDSLPRSIAISTGMDALTHAIEASVALNASEITRSFALEAAVSILENLETSVDLNICESERNIAKERVHIASAMAGIAITNSCTGIVHSYDHPGPMFSIPHGVVCGVMLPYTMELCGIQYAYITIAKRLGYIGNQEELFEKLINHLFQLMKRLGLNTSFSQFDIQKELYFSKVKEWSDNSLEAFATRVSPANMTLEKGEQLYKMCYDGQINKR